MTLALVLLLSFGHIGSQLSLANETSFTTLEIADLDKPWAMAFLPDGRLLVTEKPGNLLLIGGDGSVQNVSGVPDVAYGGQGGLGMWHCIRTLNQTSSST